MVDGAVAVLVGVAATNEHHIDGESLIEQPLLTLDIDDLHDVLSGGAVELAAAVAGIHEGIQAHMGDGAHLVGGDVAVHMGDDALGQVVGLDLVLQRQRAQRCGAVPVAADDALDHALVAVVVAAGAVPVALTCREEQRQVTGMAGLQKSLFHRFAERLRAGRADEAAGGDGVAVVDQQGGLLGGDDAYFLHAGPLTCSGRRRDAFPGMRPCPPSGRQWRSTWRTARSLWRCRRQCPSACPGRYRPWHTSRRWGRSW